MAPNNANHVVMENVRILFHNFQGKEGQYNREGDRNFSVALDDDIAEAMAKDGWLVKWLKSKNEGEEDQAFLPISLRFDIYPPRVVLITSRGRNEIGEEEIELLDFVDIRTVDLIVRPYEWLVNGKAGIKAYLKSIYVTIEEDALELKYRDVEENEH